MSVSAVYTVDTTTFNSVFTSLKKTFNFDLRAYEHMPVKCHISKNRLTVTLRFEDDADKTKFEDYFYRNEDY